MSGSKNSTLSPAMRTASLSVNTSSAAVSSARSVTGLRSINPAARGEPFLWSMGGALVLGVFMIIAFLILIFWNGITTFYPKPIVAITLADGKKVAGEPSRRETFRPDAATLQGLDDSARAAIAANGGFAWRTLYKIGNFDLYNEDFKWVADTDARSTANPVDIFFIERVEWGPFIGFIKALNLDGQPVDYGADRADELDRAHSEAVERRNAIRRIERKEIARINHRMEEHRLNLRAIELKHGAASSQYEGATAEFAAEAARLNDRFQALQQEADRLKEQDSRFTLTLADVNGREKVLPLSAVVRLYPANSLNLFDKIGIYLSRWIEYLTAEPREANTEGGVMPAIFGTFIMTLLMVLAVAPFGVMAALYLREYAKQGRLVSIVRICVNNLAGVPSIVYGVFGLGFFAYIIGGGIDRLFYPERLPSPTFGTGGVLWAALTLALLTVPVVIVATEEALAAVPPSLREGSLACGASKWQTIKHIVLPKAMPGIMTGLILAMARGAGEVAPLMLVGVVKLAPELPVDSYFPFVHLERSFMHLGFHIFDVGFQSRNSEAGKPMVFVTTLLLISLVAMMNALAIVIRNRLKRKYVSGHF